MYRLKLPVDFTEAYFYVQNKNRRQPFGMSPVKNPCMTSYGGIIRIRL